MQSLGHPKFKEGMQKYGRKEKKKTHKNLLKKEEITTGKTKKQRTLEPTAI
ncbi:hypothetical protein JBD44_38 [Pseudomonas phage JBD44]|uniref:hypothetical protein n=1 Tax=Pseudomonas phage JBD44 TaxID=1777052 RepID=UPI00076AE617|nr:hypothetical protein BH779_gp38 [Pseudomonas phage JBD44]AMD42699.1 hypothetical protein JBD44_38 [Pseudomonas phage JBD44]